jgi:hypothetical protein
MVCEEEVAWRIIMRKAEECLGKRKKIRFCYRCPLYGAVCTQIVSLIPKK